MLDINCFWFGGSLGDLEQVCLLSMLRQGHRVRLFSYEKLSNVPAGIEMSDARDVLPREEFIFHGASGSPALGTNRFRYRIMKKGLGLWLDTDVILVKPIQRDEEYIFGWQDLHQINGAVLYLPSESAIVDEIIAFASQEYPIPPFYDAAIRRELARRSRSGAPVGVEALQWGVLGPRALTYFVHKNDLQRFAKPRSVFYPVHWTVAHALFSLKHNNRNLMHASTIAVHLWNSVLRRPSKIRPANPVGELIVENGCFVERFAREHLGFRMESSL